MKKKKWYEDGRDLRWHKPVTKTVDILQPIKWLFYIFCLCFLLHYFEIINLSFVTELLNGESK